MERIKELAQLRMEVEDTLTKMQAEKAREQKSGLDSGSSDSGSDGAGEWVADSAVAAGRGFGRKLIATVAGLAVTAVIASGAVFFLAGQTSGRGRRAHLDAGSFANSARAYPARRADCGSDAAGDRGGSHHHGENKSLDNGYRKPGRRSSRGVRLTSATAARSKTFTAAQM